jgi:putative flippase GtrA
VKGEQGMTHNQKTQKDGSLKDLWLGIGLSLGIYLLGLFILLVVSPIFMAYVCIAVVAIIVIPIVSFVKGRKRLGQGALIGLGLNILLFTACFGIILYNLGG